MRVPGRGKSRDEGTEPCEGTADSVSANSISEARAQLEAWLLRKKEQNVNGLKLGEDAGK